MANLTQDPVPVEPEDSGEGGQQQELSTGGRPHGLTSRQSLLWLDEQLFPDARNHNLVLTIDTTGPLDVPRLREAWRRTVLDFDGLRTAVDRAKPMQVVVSEVPDLPLVNLASAEAMSGWIEERSTRALGVGPTSLRWDAALLALPGERHVFFVCQHHLIADGLSMLIMAEHLSQLYTGHEPAPAASFGEYVRSEAEYRRSPKAERDRQYWSSKLPVGLPALQLYGRRRIDTSAVLARGTWAAGTERAQGLAGLSQQEPFRTITASLSRLVTIVTALTAFLYRASGQREILIGVPFGNRPSRFARTYGLLFEQLFLYLELDEGETFESLGAKVRHEVTASIRHGQYCVSDRGLHYVTLNMLPAFPTSFGELPATYSLGPATMLARADHAGTSDLHETFGLLVNDFADADLQLSLDMHAATFDPTVRDRAGAHILRIIDGMLSNLATPIDQVDLMDEAERRRVLDAARGPEPAENAPDLIEAFRRQVAAHPERTAVEAAEGVFTYSELDRLSDVLADRLSTEGVGRGARVAVSLPRGCGELVSFLAVLKTGSAYIPIDSSHPAERIRHLLGEARPKVLIAPSDSPLREVLPGGSTLFAFDDAMPSPVEAPRTWPSDAPTADQIAYILFTSGSSGRPKGVEVQRGALANFLRSMSVSPGLGPEDRLLAITTTTFDIAGLELFLPLCVGAAVVIADADIARDPRQLRARLELGDITVMQATPVTWRLLLEAGWEGTREGAAGLRMLCGGEKLSRDLAKRLLATGGELWNLYGPTETTIWSTVERVGADADRITIGRPIDHTQVYVLDGNRRPVPAGIVGELYIAGRGLARGYLGRPDMTAESFFPDPFGSPGSRIYRTGDLGRLHEDGRFECLGRIDHQVKVRGFRVEVEEIEGQLRDVPGVDEALVTASPDARGDTRLCAYWVGTAGPKELQDHLRTRLPGYMVPSAFVPVPSFPLNANGKIDRRRLPAPAEGYFVGSPEGTPLRTVKEERMAAIWSEVLQTAVTDSDQDFFDLGGTSIKVIELRLAVEKAFGVRLPLGVFFEAPTIRNLVDMLGDVQDTSDPIVVRLRQGTEQGDALHCLLGIELYRDLAASFPEDIRVYGLHVPFDLGAASPASAVEDLASRYLQPIRSVQPNGPYHLAGLCLGGLLAFEAARQLEAAGEIVGSVSLFDASLPAEGLAGTFARAWKRMAKVKQIPRRIGEGWQKRTIVAHAGATEPEIAGVQRLGAIDVEAQVRCYLAQQRRIRSPLVVFRATSEGQSRRRWAKTMGWKGRSPFLTCYDVPAGHLGLVRRPQVEEIAHRIAALIHRASSDVQIGTDRT